MFYAVIFLHVTHGFGTSFNWVKYGLSFLSTCPHTYMYDAEFEVHHFGKVKIAI